ncbi:hypothetical protein EON83_03955 [bacterium]|nr:MAG: hypothetical protein EON83_03955 [bacterium]
MDEQALFVEQKRRVEQARLALEQDANGDLSYRHVMSILAMYGPPLENGVINAKWGQKLGVAPAENQASLRGWQRRSWNALLCAEKVLPLWSFDTIKPHLNQHGVDALGRLNLGNHIVDAKVAVLLEEEFSVPDFRPGGESLVCELADQSKASVLVYQASGAYWSIEQILILIRIDKEPPFATDRIYPEKWEDDDDVDWGQYPPAIYTSCAIAGESNSANSPLNDIHARRQFWLWWLNEVVPASWNLQELND